MSLSVKVYKMLGSTPNPTSDYCLGEATYMGGGIYNYNLPPTAIDYPFYYLGQDEAGNKNISTVQHYYNGTNGLTIRLSSGVEFALLRGDFDGLIKLRYL